MLYHRCISYIIYHPPPASYNTFLWWPHPCRSTQRSLCAMSSAPLPQFWVGVSEDSLQQRKGAYYCVFLENSSRYIFLSFLFSKPPCFCWWWHCFMLFDNSIGDATLYLLTWWFHPMRCGAVEVTGLGFLCFVVFNPPFMFFKFIQQSPFLHIFQLYLPPPASSPASKAVYKSSVGWDQMLVTLQQLVKPASPRGMVVPDFHPKFSRWGGGAVLWAFVWKRRERIDISWVLSFARNGFRGLGKPSTMQVNTFLWISLNLFMTKNWVHCSYNICIYDLFLFHCPELSAHLHLQYPHT